MKRRSLYGATLALIGAVAVIFGGFEAGRAYSAAVAKNYNLPYAANLRFPSTGQKVMIGTGAPESSVVAPVGSIYLRKDGTSSANSVYVKNFGTSNTGWGLNKSGRQELIAASAQTVAGSAAVVLTAGANFYPLQSTSGAVTGITIPAVTTVGECLTFEGQSDTNTVSFTTNGVTNIKGTNGGTTAVLGAFDILKVCWDGTAYVQQGAVQNNT